MNSNTKQARGQGRRFVTIDKKKVKATRQEQIKFVDPDRVLAGSIHHTSKARGCTPMQHQRSS